MFMRRLTILLSPGLGLKRWLALLLLGVLLFALGAGFAMSVPLSHRILPMVKTLTFSGLPPLVRGAIFISAGAAVAALALFQTYRLLVSGVLLSRGKVDVLTALERRRRQEQGLRIVAIGGGTGLSTLLRGLKHETKNITAIVNITDDGGSSGQLRTDLGIPPPGDARNCLVALSESEPLLEELFNYRFQQGASLDGHSLGNLLLAALCQIKGGFGESLQSAAQLLALSGRVLPVSNHSNLVLMAETVSGQVIKGESAVGNAPAPLQRVWLEPEGADANPAALEAIRDAELITIGPGSLYTSIVPNFLLTGMREAMQASGAPKVFICNVATERHETDNYGVADHLRAFIRYSGVPVTHILVNNNVEPLPQEWDQVALPPESSIQGFTGAVVLADLVDTALRTRHDPQKLASALLALQRNLSKRTKVPSGRP